MKNIEALDEGTINIFSSSLGILSGKVKEEKIDEKSAKVMSSNLTSLHNAFHRIKTYSQNMLSIQKAVATSTKQAAKENTLENNYESKPLDALSSNIMGRFPAVIQALEKVTDNIQNTDLVSKGSIMGGIAGNIAALGIGAAALAGIGGIAAYDYLTDDEEEEYTPPPPGKSSLEKEDEPKITKPSKSKSDQTDFERLAKDGVQARKQKIGAVSSIFVAESIRDMVNPSSSVIGKNIFDTASNMMDRFFNIGNAIAGLTPAGGNEAAAQAMDYFMSQGWSREQSAGIVGNLQQESGNFAPDVVTSKRRGDNGNAFGIAQWNQQYSPDRIQNFKKQVGKPIPQASLQEQLNFIQWELKNTHKKAANLLRKTDDPVQAAAIIDKYYEVSDGHSRAQRQANAQALASGDGLGGYEKVKSSGRGGGYNFRPTYAKDAFKQLDAVDDSSLQVPTNMMKYIRTNGRVNLKDIHPTVMKRFSAMAMEYKNKTGDTLQVNSGYRTYAEQATLYRTLPRGRAARPGTSRHETGLAIDIQSVQANKLASLGLLGKYKFERPVKGEAWHLEPREGLKVPRLSNVEESVGSDTKAAQATREAANSNNKVAPLSEQRAVRKIAGRGGSTIASPGSRGSSSPARPAVGIPQRAAKKQVNANPANWLKAYLTK